MRLTPPKKIVWWISLILGVVGLVGKFVAIPFISAYAFWFVLVALVLLLLANVMKGL